MELHSWCVCGKQTHDEKNLYCSIDCQNKELNPKQVLSPPPSPPSDCRFSVAIATNMLFPNDLTSVVNDGFLSPQSSAASSYTESNPCSSVTSTADRYHMSKDLYDDGNYYYSTSAPIDIRQAPPLADGESLEINKGTFGEHKLHI
uniref:Sulfate/thiosulfate import ATP-binding protein CysA 1 n=1 Tax=Anthurium amnicola TaxID=1678845 RepID=A0A1D1XLZ1_9ARAE